MREEVSMGGVTEAGGVKVPQERLQVVQNAQISQAKQPEANSTKPRPKMAPDIQTLRETYKNSQPSLGRLLACIFFDEFSLKDYKEGMRTSKLAYEQQLTSFVGKFGGNKAETKQVIEANRAFGMRTVNIDHQITELEKKVRTLQGRANDVHGQDKIPPEIQKKINKADNLMLEIEGMIPKGGLGTDRAKALQHNVKTKEGMADIRAKMLEAQTILSEVAESLKESKGTKENEKIAEKQEATHAKEAQRKPEEQREANKYKLAEGVLGHILANKNGLNITNLRHWAGLESRLHKAGEFDIPSKKFAKDLGHEGANKIELTFSGQDPQVNIKYADGKITSLSRDQVEELRDALASTLRKLR
jgi:hypothetical protein